MDLEYIMSIQNAHGTKSRRERELAKVNRQMKKHFEDTFDTEDVLINGEQRKIMIIMDTDSNVYKKKIKSIHNDKFCLGDYVQWNNQYWLITLLDPDPKTWNRGYMYLCIVPLRWQNEKGEIIERYGYSEDFTKYSTGLTGSNTIKVGDNQYGITLPADEETKKLCRDMRFVIDFEDTTKPDVYKLTNRKVLLNNDDYFDRGGTIVFTLSYDSYNKYVDKKVKRDNGSEVWICNYHNSEFFEGDTQETIPESSVNVSILGEKDIKIGYSRTYTVEFTDENDIAIEDYEFSWNVISDFEIQCVESDNTITLKVDNDDYAGEFITLQIISDGDVVCEKVIPVMGIF